MVFILIINLCRLLNWWFEVICVAHLGHLRIILDYVDGASRSVQPNTYNQNHKPYAFYSLALGMGDRSFLRLTSVKMNRDPPLPYTKHFNI